MAADDPSYLWIAVCGCIVGFVYAFGIGANDVANAFASSVSSKSLTLKQAIIAAGIFEFAGSILLGAAVTSTIRSKVVDVSLYDDNPDLLMFGMFTSLLTATMMLLTATHFALPVSTTHTIVGCIMGFSIAAKGFDSVDWEVGKKIFISWVASPLISGFLGFIMYGSLRIFVLSNEQAYIRAYYTFPLVLTIGIGIDLFYILYKGLNNLPVADKLSVNWVLPMSFGIGAVCGLIWIFGVGPIARRRTDARRVALDQAAAQAEKTKGDEEDLVEEIDVDAPDKPAEDPASSLRAAESSTTPEPEAPAPTKPKGRPSMMKAASSYLSEASEKFADNTFRQDLEKQSMEENQRASKIWEKSIHYDPDAEYMFTYIQVFTACLNSFAHGANDISNAIAPVSAILLIYQTGAADSKAPVQKWILAYGGLGLVLGLLIYGYKVMKSVGYKIAAMSPSRGATAELAASLTVVTATFFEIPVSSTQCIVGAVSGIGLTFGPKQVQWFFLLRVMIGWVGIFFVSVVLSAGVFAFAAFSPDLHPYNATAAN